MPKMIMSDEMFAMERALAMAERQRAVAGKEAMSSVDVIVELMRQGWTLQKKSDA